MEGGSANSERCGYERKLKMTGKVMSDHFFDMPLSWLNGIAEKCLHS